MGKFMFSLYLFGFSFDYLFKMLTIISGETHKLILARNEVGNVFEFNILQLQCLD